MQDVVNNNSSNPEVNLEQFESVLIEDKSLHGKLWQAWHFIQVYSTWAVKLPSSVEDLSGHLGIPKEDISNYSFFIPMQQAHSGINNAASQFLNETFPRVIKLGSSLRSFAEENKSGNNSIWDLIIDLVSDKETYPDVLDFIGDLQKKAKENEAEAQAIEQLLSSYSTALQKASGTLQRVNTAVEADEKTSEATIARLSGGVDQLGSLKQIEDLIEKNQKNYDSAVKKAATTPTYAWIIPFGTVAATVVAAIYGKAAVDALAAYNGANTQLKEEKKDLDTAIKTKAIMKLANASVDNTQVQTKQALIHITTVKNAWSGLAANLDIVKTKVINMTKKKEGSEQEILKGAKVIDRYAKDARAAWDKLWPAIVELTDEPYIKVEEEEKTPAQISTAIQFEMTKLNLN